MADQTLESRNVSLVAHTDLDGHPPFKLNLKEVDGRWLLYTSTFFYSGWSIVDVTDPAEPELVRWVEGPDNTMTKNLQVAGDLMVPSIEKPHEGYGPHGVSMDPSEPYEEGALFYDLSGDPTDPELVGHYETGGTGTHRNFYAGGDYAYLCAQPADFDRPRPKRNFMLAVVDVSDPSTPEEVARWWWPGQSVEDEEEPGEAFYLHGPAYVQGDRAHLSYGRVGAVTLDVSDPTDPTYRCRAPLGDAIGSWVGIHSFIPIPGTDLASANTEVNVEQSPLEDGGQAHNFACLIDISEEHDPEIDPAFKGAMSGYKIVSMLQPPSPEDHLPYDSYHEKGGRFGPHNQHHPRGEDERLQSSDLLFYAYFNAGLRIYDVSDPLMPEEVGHYVPTDPEETVGSRLETPAAQFEDVVVDSRGYIYCSDSNQGLYIMETDLV